MIACFLHDSRNLFLLRQFGDTGQRLEISTYHPV